MSRNMQAGPVNAIPYTIGRALHLRGIQIGSVAQ